MRRFLSTLLCLLIIGLVPLQGQDALNLPSELYVLSNEGVVQRFGLGSEGVSTVTSDDEFVLDFRIAPDANWLAYRTQEGMFLSNIFDDSTSPRQIEDDRASLPPIRGRGETIAWSPDSSVLAYTTEYGGRVHFFADNTFVDLTTPDLLNLIWSPNGAFLAAEALENVWWIYQRDGASIILRSAISGANGADWLSNNQLLYAPIEGGMTIMDLTAGNQQIEILSNASTYFKPSVTRDGQIVAFTGDFTTANLVQIDLSDNFVGTPTVIGSNTIDLTGVRWTPGGFLLTAFQGGVIALQNPITANGFTLPVTSASAYSWGPEYPPLVTNVPLPSNGYFIAPDLDGILQVWQLPADGSRPSTVTSATLDISEFAVSPNGQQIVYVSNSILWQIALGADTEPIELVMLGINEDVTPAWSPDNNSIYYRDEQSTENGIWRVQVGNDPELFLPDTDTVTFTDPNPALGVGAMLVQAGDELALVDTTSGEVTMLGIRGEGQWQTGTQYTAVGDAVSGNGLYLGDANNALVDPALLLPLLGSFQLFDYRIVDDGATLRVLVKNQVPGDVRILDISLADGQGQLVGNAGHMVFPRLSLDGNIIVGQRSPIGALLIYDFLNDTTRQIDIPIPISNFVWQ